MKALCLLLVLCALGAPAWSGGFVGAPDTPPSWVDDGGSVHEDWGVFGVRIEEPSGAKVAGQEVRALPFPSVVTTVEAGPVTLRLTAYRAPIWPAGVDVVSAQLSNTGSDEAATRLRLSLPDNLGMGERVGVAGGRSVLCLPANLQPSRIEGPWGCLGGDVPMPGWATPVGECDPAFRNIRAGMGGVPVAYRFQVPAGAKRTVVLGFCESFHSQAGARPLVVKVEGTPGAEVDPLAAWGRHVPGCLRFDAWDVNGDGRLEISIQPHPRAQDRNPILNAIWVFAPEVQVNTNDVLSGKMSSAAEYYVDVGGEKDRLIYEDAVAYDLRLAPGARQEFIFALACAGAAVPDLTQTAWTPGSLRKAAEDAWADCFAQGAALPGPLLERSRAAVAQVVMMRGQADGYFAALPAPGLYAEYSHAGAAQMIAALDVAGYGREAERMLRVYWEKPAPQPLAGLAQSDDGQWRDAANDPRAQGAVLQALARHALLTGDREWARRAWPAIQSGCDWLAKQGGLSAEAKQAGAAGLMGAARVAELLDLPDAKALAAQARGLDPQAAWGWDGASGGGSPAALQDPEGPSGSRGAETARLRNALVTERGRELWLLSGVDETWLKDGALSAEGLPTEFGPIALGVKRAAGVLDVEVTLAPGGDLEALVICAPALDGAKPSTAKVDGRAAPLGPRGEVRIAPAAGPHYDRPAITRVTFIYQ